MKQKKIIHYKIPVSRTYLSGHPKRGKQTFFKEKIQLALNLLVELPGDMVIDLNPKLHTIRHNYLLWSKRMQKVRAGKAVIDLCEWKLPGGRFTTGNELIAFATLDKDSECGVQELIFSQKYEFKGLMAPMVNNDKVLSIVALSENDGLEWLDFEAWFEKYDITKSMAIIQFTSFRY